MKLSDWNKKLEADSNVKRSELERLERARNAELEYTKERNEIELDKLTRTSEVVV